MNNSKCVSAEIDTHSVVIEKMSELYMDLFEHNGFGHMRLEIRFLKKGQKEVIIICGKEYRYVLNYDTKSNKK